MAGKRFDNAVRDLVARGADELCSMLLGRGIRGAKAVGEALPAVPLEADSLFRLPGEARLVHVEFQLRADRADIHPRLARYWGRIEERYGVAPVQHVVVLRPPGRLPGIYQEGEMLLRYTAHHLWDIPARRLLGLGPLAALAVLGRLPPGRSAEALLVEVLGTIRAATTGEERMRQLTHAATLASARIEPPTIDEIFRRWSDVPIEMSEFPLIRYFTERAAAEATVKVAAETRVRTTVELLNELLSARFGQLDPIRREAVDSLDPARREQLLVALLEIRTLDQLDGWLAQTGETA